MTAEQMITLGLLLLILAFAIWAYGLSKGEQASASRTGEQKPERSNENGDENSANDAKQKN